MLCRQCGNEIRDDARFCPHCGAVNNPDLGRDLPAGAAPYSAPAYTGPEAPVSGGKKKTGLLIGGAVAAVAVIALLVVVVSGLFSNPKGQVEKALASSYAAYETAEKALGMPDISKWQKDRSIFQSMTLRLNSINSQLVGYDLSALSGLEIGASMGYSGKDRFMDVEANANWGLDELFLFRMTADDAELYFHSPQLTGEAYYGVNTETLGADLTAMTGDNSMETLSFNLFDLMETVLDKVDREAVERAVKEANKALWDAVQVEKIGKESVDINGTLTKTNVYLVTIPQEALEDYADALITASAVDYTSLYRELFQSMGMPEEELGDLLSELEAMDVYSGLSKAVKETIARLGDVELTVYTGGGYVSKAVYHYNRNGIDLTAALCLGGGGEYVDNLSLELYGDEYRVTVESNGDHGLKDGVYTDETTIQVRQSGANAARVTSKLSYDPRKEQNNFQCDLRVDSSGLSLFGLEAQGDLHVKEDIVDLTLEDAACKVMGMEVCGLRFNYRISRCPDRLKQPMENSKLITEMDMSELMAFANELERNAETWASDMEALFAARLPAELYSFLS